MVPTVIFPKIINKPVRRSINIWAITENKAISVSVLVFLFVKIIFCTIYFSTMDPHLSKKYLVYD